MSISPPTATTTNSDTSTAHHHLTYWCHECDMSVLILPPLSSACPLLCPHCRHDFLEQMDSPPNPTTTTTTTTTAAASAPIYLPFSSMETDSNSFPFLSEDNFLLDSSYYYRLVNSLMTATTTNNNNNDPVNPPQYNSPASKSSIESLHHITVDSAFLQNDPTIVCPVCKDQFSIDSEAKSLPCTHTYHADCIVPWLEINNSCPVCRYKLPSEYDARKHDIQVGESSIEARLDELLEDEQDLFGFTSILRNVVRRQLQSSSSENEEHDRNVENWNRRVVWDNEVLFSPTQIGEAESGGGGSGSVGRRRRDHVERANSVETVTSWPTWPVDGGASGSGSGGGDGDMGVGVKEMH